MASLLAQEDHGPSCMDRACCIERDQRHPFTCRVTFGSNRLRFPQKFTPPRPEGYTIKSKVQTKLYSHTIMSGKISKKKSTSKSKSKQVTKPIKAKVVVTPRPPPGPPPKGPKANSKKNEMKKGPPGKPPPLQPTKWEKPPPPKGSKPTRRRRIMWSR